MNKYFAVIFLSISFITTAQDSLVLNAGTTGYGGIHLAHNYGVASINANPAVAVMNPTKEKFSELQISINDKYQPNKGNEVSKDSQFFIGGYRASNNILLGMTYYEPGRNQFYSSSDGTQQYLLERETFNILMAKHWLGMGFGVNINVDLTTIEEATEVITDSTPIELSVAVPLLSQQINLFNTALFIDMNFAAKYSPELTSNNVLKDKPTLEPETHSASIALEMLHGNSSLSWQLTLAADLHNSKYSAFNQQPFWLEHGNTFTELELEVRNYGASLSFINVYSQGYDLSLSYGCIVYKGDTDEKFTTAGIGFSGEVFSVDIAVHESFLVKDEVETQIALTASF